MPASSQAWACWPFEYPASATTFKCRPSVLVWPRLTCPPRAYVGLVAIQLRRSRPPRAVAPAPQHPPYRVSRYRELPGDRPNVLALSGQYSYFQLVLLSQHGGPKSRRRNTQVGQSSTDQVGQFYSVVNNEPARHRVAGGVEPAKADRPRASRIAQIDNRGAIRARVLGKQESEISRITARLGAGNGHQANRQKLSPARTPRTPRKNEKINRINSVTELIKPYARSPITDSLWRFPSQSSSVSR